MLPFVVQATTYSYNIHANTNSTKSNNAVVFPDLDEILNPITGEIIGDVNFLLDWAVLGFPKCGTTSLLKYLNTGTSSIDLEHERCDAGYSSSRYDRNMTTLIRSLYHDLYVPNNGNVTIARGLKCPKGLVSRSVLNFDRYFPNTQIIIGVRHPITWFQSFYNYRIRDGYNIPYPHELMGRCTGRSEGVCADNARFHYLLARLGKTNMTSAEEMQLLFRNANAWMFDFGYVRTKNQVFLYEVDQLGDVNASRAELFRRDLARFIHVPEDELGPMIHSKPGRKNLKPFQQEYVDKYSINICDEEHDELRSVLMLHAVDASRWIRKYFLESPDVMVSSKYYLDEILAKWEIDKCYAEESTATA